MARRTAFVNSEDNWGLWADWVAVWWYGQAYGVLEFQEQRLDTAKGLYEEGLKRDPMHVMLFQVRTAESAGWRGAWKLFRQGRLLGRLCFMSGCWMVFGYV